MHQFSRNTGLMFKTFLYQIVMSLFGFMMYSATNKNTLLLVVGQTLVILFYYYILSSQMFQAGGKAYEFDRSHSLSSSPALGFLFALIAFLPAILISLFTVLSPPYSAEGVAQATGYVPFLLNKTFLQGMYISIVQWIFPTVSGGASEALAVANANAMNSQCLLYLAGALPGMVICGTSYLIGYLSFGKEKNK